MNKDKYQAIGPDRPLGDREGAEEDWTPKRVKEISEDEVENPDDDPDLDQVAPIPERDIEESERKD